MRIVYTAPNRAHHYRYAEFLSEANLLKAFVTGYPRFSQLSRSPKLENYICRADRLQCLYLMSLRLNLGKKIRDFLAYSAKIEQDYSCRKWIDEETLFLFYNGSGLATCEHANRCGGTTIVEVVNSHVDVQEEILEEEHHALKLPWQPFYGPEKRRRLKEYETADYILVPSEFSKRSFISRGFSEEKLLKVCYGYEQRLVDGRDQRSRPPNTPFTILYVGSISVRKGVRYLIEAFQRFSHPRKKLLIVGPSAKPSGLEGLSIPAGVEFTGPLKGESLENAYRSADVFCLPTLEDGFGLVLGEALSYGLPIIATDHSGAVDLIVDGLEGFLLPPRNAERISHSLELLAASPDLYQRMQEAAASKASRLSGWSDTGTTLVSTLNQLLSQKNR